MGARFLPRLVNGPFDDPALYISFRYQNRALLFDAGDVSALSARDILKISHIFVSHTHMDHFIGFDHVLRLLLGRDKDLHVYGPQGFLANLKGKLAGYCWNLVGNYRNRFTLHATELRPDRAIHCSFSCHHGFIPSNEVHERSFTGTVVSEPELTVQAVHLDHGTPVLAFRLEERFHVNIINNALNDMGLSPGPWLTHFKSLIYQNADPATPIVVPPCAAGQPEKRILLGTLQSAIARTRPGQRLAYITDASGSLANMQR